jgi:autotransporter translocation and assembly factor TamB
MNRARRVFLWGGSLLATLLMLLGALMGWLLFTTSGARWVAGAVTQRFAPQVKYGALDGTLAGPLTIKDFRFEDGADKPKIRIGNMTVDPTLRMLLSRTLRIERATVAGLVLALPEQPKPEDPNEPLWIEPPLEVTVRDFALTDARIMDGREQILSVKQVSLAARWTREALILERLTLLPGDVAGELAARGRITPEGKTVHAALSARWRQVVIPASLAGRTLASAGNLDIDGTPQRYAARGTMDLGPPGELGHITLAVHGTDK